MKGYIPYKNCLIRGESFQLESSGWIPRFTLMRRDGDTTWNHFLHHDRLDKVFSTKSEADAFALQDAKHCIDRP